MRPYHGAPITGHLGPNGTTDYTCSIAECINALWHDNAAPGMMLMVQWDASGVQALSMGPEEYQRTYDAHERATISDHCSYPDTLEVAMWLVNAYRAPRGEDKETSFRYL